MVPFCAQELTVLKKVVVNFSLVYLFCHMVPSLSNYLRYLFVLSVNFFFLGVIFQPIFRQIKNDNKFSSLFFKTCTKRERGVLDSSKGAKLTYFWVHLPPKIVDDEEYLFLSEE